MTGISDADPSEWDAFSKKHYRSNDGFDISDAECVLPANHHEMMRRDRERREEDDINMPAHYRVGEVESIDYIAQQLGSGVRDFLLGNVHKYLHRHRFKGHLLADLKKAQWYLNKLIMEEEQGGVDGEK